MGFQNTGRHLSGLPGLILALLLVLATPTANAESLRILSQNMNRLFDNIDDGNHEKILSRGRFQQRVKNAARKFGDDYRLPHIIALQEVENRHVLQQIAAEIRQRYHTGYALVLIPGQDISGINLAFLVRLDVQIKNIEQLFGDAKFKLTGNPLFSRPPLYLEACTINHCISLLNVHLRSMRGIDSDRDGSRVTRKRRRQAETIAAWSDGFQRSREGISLLLLGDFNALTPSDVHVDVAGIIRGNPDNTTAALPGRDLLEPDLVDLTELIPPAKRYSFIFRHNKQQLDYMFVNRGFAADVEDIAFSRIDYRFSDHAGLLAWFELY
jgi:endonuclease/exonuclease/phosphatase family metal-dependent hydrolase